MKHPKSSHQFCLIFYGWGERRASDRTSQVFFLMSGFHVISRASGDASEAQSWEGHDPSKHLCHSWYDSIVLANALILPVLQFRNEEKQKGISHHLEKKSDMPKHFIINFIAMLHAEKRQVICKETFFLFRLSREKNH